VRGKLRKPFQLTQLLDFYFKQKQAIVEINPDDAVPRSIFAENFSNLNECWNRLCDLQFDESKLNADLESLSIAKWMSSLACCNSHECDSIHARITGTASIFNAASASSTEGCPIGCLCDNPWPFLTVKKTEG
jgi:hypothetical protein